MKIKKERFYTTENVQNYVNFINDHNLGNKLSTYDTGFSDGKFFLDIEGDEELIGHIKRLSMQLGRGQYIRTTEIKLKQSKLR